MPLIFRSAITMFPFFSAFIYPRAPFFAKRTQNGNSK